MPELPEVETIVRALRPRLVGAVIAGARVGRRDYVRAPRPSAGAYLAGKRIRVVRRHGKRFSLVLEPAGLVTVHLGMSGRIDLGRPGDPAAKHTHFRVSLRDRALEMRVRDPRRFGGVWVTRDGGGPGDGLGPDALRVRLAGFRRILDRPRQIKALLLDQRAIAGLGNIYCDEALFASRLHPLTRAASLAEAERRRLLDAIRSLLTTAIRHGGSTIRDYRDAAGLAGGFQERHRVYGRDGEPCPRCGGPIGKILVASRTTHLCPRCQPLRRG